jgi:hypothetical protein
MKQSEVANLTVEQMASLAEFKDRLEDEKNKKGGS